jgi:hypothetical protein
VATSKAALRRLAAEVRVELGLKDSDPFDPIGWAKEYGVRFVALQDLSDAGQAVERFLRQRPKLWSAALLRDGTGYIVVYNNAHSPARVRSDLAHEAAHLIAEHELSSGWMTDDSCSGGGAPQEKEAIELAGALLVPDEAARVHAIRGGSPLALADVYRVSLEMATWRMRVSGGAIIAERSRKRRTSLPR